MAFVLSCTINTGIRQIGYNNFISPLTGRLTR